jgi:hypothetical protein
MAIRKPFLNRRAFFSSDQVCSVLLLAYADDSRSNNQDVRYASACRVAPPNVLEYLCYHHDKLKHIGHH